MIHNCRRDQTSADSGPKPSWWVLCCGILLAVAVRLFLYEARETADGTRFRLLAESILAGKGYSDSHGLCTYLPPGYSLFLAGVFSLSRESAFLHASQMASSIATCALLYFAVLPRGRVIASFALFGMAVHAWSARFVGYDMSETFSMFLSGLLAGIVSRIESQRTDGLTCLLFGMLAIAIPLTAPATIVSCYLLIGIMGYRHRSRPCAICWILFGVLAVLVPWEIHCASAGVGFQPTLLSKPRFLNSSFLRWYRTWGTNERDLEITWAPFRSETLPRSVCNSDEEYQELLRVRRAWETDYLVSQGSITTLERDTILAAVDIDETFETARRRRIETGPMFSLVGSPLLRAWNLLIREPDRAMWDRQPIPYGVGRVWWGGVALAYAVFSLSAIVIPLFSSRDSRAVPAALLVGFIVYIGVSAFTGSTESRRNFPFLPLGLFGLYYLPSTRYTFCCENLRSSDTEAVPRSPVANSSRVASSV